MKRLILASALSAVALSASAVEIGAPYEQLNIDRQLPNIEFAPVEPYVADSRAPFEQLAIDRALPNPPVQNAQVAGVGSSTPAGAPGPPAAPRWNSPRSLARLRTCRSRIRKSPKSVAAPGRTHPPAKPPP